MTASASPSCLWRKPSWVCERLGISPTKLKDAMRATPEHIAPAWRNISFGTRPEYRWLAADVDR